MQRTRHWGMYVAVLLLAGLLAGGFAGAAEVTLPITIDPLKPEHRELVQPQFGSFFYPGPDPYGNVVFIMGQEMATFPEDSYELRYVLFDIGELREFSLEFASMGWVGGSGNPSHFVVFGWQDYKNIYYSYPAESVATRVRRVVDGKHQTLFQLNEIIWFRDREKYQTVRVEVKEVDGRMVVDTFVNDELRMTYTYAEGEEPPAGKVGIAMWNNSAHNAYIKDITIKAL